jgi:hypothetical protein
MSGDEPDRLLFSAPRTRFGQRGPAGEELRLMLRSYEGHPFLDLRVWYRAGAEWRPTKKGTSIKLTELRGLVVALLAIGRELFPKPNASPTST